MPSRILTRTSSFLRSASPLRRSRRNSSTSIPTSKSRSSSPSPSATLLSLASPYSTTTPPSSTPSIKDLETDEQCWNRMLALQKEFHCYNSARLEAAVLALERGDMGRVGVPSRLCLNLLNEGLRVRIEREGFDLI